MLQLLAYGVGAIDFVVNWGLGWRFLVSPTFRAKLRTRWKTLSKGKVAAEVTFCVVCFLVLNGILILFVTLIGIWLYQGIVAPRLIS
jgi:hypothetical protein